MGENDSEGFGMAHPTAVPANHEPTTVSTVGYINFDASLEQHFVDLVTETLESSRYIQTEWYEMEGKPDDVLLIQRVGEPGDGL